LVPFLSFPKADATQGSRSASEGGKILFCYRRACASKTRPEIKHDKRRRELFSSGTHGRQLDYHKKANLISPEL
jgi:hypothetical protein